MKKEITKNIRRLFEKCRTFIDSEIYVPIIFNKRSRNDEISDKIIGEIERAMVENLFHLENHKVLIPTIYKVFINAEDNARFCGILRESLFAKINGFIEKQLRRLSIDTFNNKFVQIRTGNVESGEVLVLPHWENGNSPPDIRFNLNPAPSSTQTWETFPSLFKPDFEYSNCDEITLIRPALKTFFTMEIWHNQNYERILPIHQTQISLGRSLPADIQLSDPEISRRHAILWTESEGIFNIMVTGKSPVFIGETAVPQGQTATLLFGETLTLGSYDLKLCNV